ncbi:MAG: hypothetical protein WBW79_06795 [Desulfocapsaceae bacterium]
MTSNLSATILQSIAANKFYPPRINTSQSIPRQAIIADKIEAGDLAQQIIVVEAQAGQGKTILVHQFLEQSSTAYIWYQVGSEDADPVVLLSALYLALSRKMADFSSPQLEAVLKNGQVGPMDLQGCANILLNDVSNALDKPLFLVLDDLHLIGQAQHSNKLLDYLIDTSPPNLHFILISRHPLELSAQAIITNPHLIYLNSNDLALDLKEIETFYNRVLKTEISRSEAQRILETTNGWIMGIVLASHPLAGRKTDVKGGPVGKTLQVSRQRPADSYIPTFFNDEILAHIPEELHQSYMKLAFLDEIDIDIAATLIDVENLALHLETMANQNFFIYRLDDENKQFRFHHLFQEFLQSMGRRVLGAEAVAAIYRTAADYYLNHERIEKALTALRHAEDYQRMEQVLQKHGLALVSANRTVTILGILESIDKDTLLAHGWLTFFHALLTTDFNPQRTLPYFENCIASFIDNGEEAGELMALSQIIYFHFVISGRYKDGSELLERTRYLYESLHSSLPAETSIIVVRNLAAGYCFFDGKMDLARHYAQQGCDLANRRNSKNFIAASRFILGYIGLLSGDLRRARNEIEKSHDLVSDPLVGMSNRLTLHVMQLCELSMNGNHAGFFYHKNLVQEGVDPEIVQQTVAAPYLHIWSAIGLISSGKRAEALEVIERGMFISQTALSEHMTSQLLQWRAFVHALEGSEEQAREDIKRSTELRMQAGGKFFVGFHRAVKGATLAILGQLDEARKQLEKALQISEEIPSQYLKACALAYLCYVDLASDNHASAELLLRDVLELMVESGYDYFWGWEPDTMLRLLSEAVKRGVEPEFARELAKSRLNSAIDDNGAAIPLLVIEILGKFSISLNGRQLFGPQDFSGHQRELFGLLISSGEQRISQAQVELALWPDSPPDKASKTFYTLISRLRKALGEKLPDPTVYINVERSHIQLTNVSIDAVNFMRLARLGMTLKKRDLWWQAGNAFHNALSCWESFSSQDIFLGDQAAMFTDEIHDTLRIICLSWARHLAKLNRIDEALALLENTGRILLSDEDIVTLVYRLYMKKKMVLKARKVLENYQQELLRLGYTEDEAAEMRDSLI